MHLYCFNPRPRMGGDKEGGGDHMNGISFNPRPRMGGDDAQEAARHMQ